MSQDIRSRESKYLMAMGIRIAAFLLIVILPIDWPWKIGLAALALVLPYVAVVYANGGASRIRGPTRRSSSRAPRPCRPRSQTHDDTAPGEPLSGRSLDDDD